MGTLTTDHVRDNGGTIIEIQNWKKPILFINKNLR